MERDSPALDAHVTRRAALGVLPLALAAVACAPRRDPNALTVWAMSYEGDYSPLLMPAFTAATGIPVEVQSLPTTASHEKLLTAHAGGSLPDVLMLFNGWVGEFAMIDALAPVPSPALVADMFDGVLATVSHGGRAYAVPWAVAPQVQYYRRDLLAAAGYDAPPENWDGWRTMGLAMKRRRPDDYVFAMLLNWPDPLLTMFAQIGARVLRDRNTRGALRTPEAREALRYYLSLFADGLAPRALTTEVQDPVAAFAQGYWAVWPSGPTTLVDFRNRKAILPRERWGTARLAGPHGPGPVSGIATSLCVSATTRRAADAWALVRHMTSAASELYFQRAIGNLPARVSAWASPQMAAPVLAPFAAQMRQPAFTPPVIEWERIRAEIQIVAERVVRGQLSVDEGLVAMDARLDETLAKRRSLVEAGKIA